jgi:hypothetical protein
MSGRARGALMGLAIALPTALAGCYPRDEVTDGDWRTVPLRDVQHSDSLLRDVWTDQRRRAPYKVWLAPQRVGERAGAPVPANRLLRARLDVYAKISCDPLPPAPDDGSVSIDGANALPIAPAEAVDALGDIVDTRVVALVGVAQPEPHMPGFAPLWMGVPLRLAGVGGTVLFGSRQNCADMTETSADALPQRGLGTADVSIPARSPFTLTLLETCPLVVQAQEQRTVRHLPIQMRLYYGDNYWLYYRKRVRLRADCPSASVEEIGPFQTPPGDYRPLDPLLDPAQLPPQDAWSDDDR